MAWYCSEPYNNVYFQQTEQGLKVAPCCVANFGAYDPDSDLYNQPYLKSIRNDFDNNSVPDACKYCVNSERKGLPSRRQTSGQKQKVNYIKNVEIHVGNYCNLKCVICHPADSSTWHRDAKQLGFKTYKKFNIDYERLDIDYSTVECIHFNGGEPLFTDTHIKILEKIEYPEKCRVNYNTNGNIKDKQDIGDLWEKFGLVFLYFSIDDIGKRFNYQRTNADWDTVKANMFWYKDNAPVNMMFGINRIISRLNYKHLNELDDWFEQKFSTNRLGDSNDFTNGFANGPTSLDSEEQEFQEYIQKLNQLRGSDV